MKKRRPTDSGPIRAVFFELSCSHCKLQPLCQGKGERSQRAKNRRKHFLGEIGQAISNLVVLLVSDLWAMAGKDGTVFEKMAQFLAAILNVPFRPNWLLDSS